MTRSDAYEKGIVIVASAGNYMDNQCLYPAAYDNVIAVGSINKNGDIESPKESIKSSMVYLPGESIVTNIRNNSYIGAYGTSFSTAICTGLVALIMETKGDKSDASDIIMYFRNKGIVKNIDFQATLMEFIDG